MWLLLLLLFSFTYASDYLDFWQEVFENRDISIRSSYAKRAWLFENTAALAGYLGSDWWKNQKSFAHYRQEVSNLKSDRTPRDVKEELTWKALVLGIVSSYSENYIIKPSTELSGKYGKSLAPTLAFRAGKQGLRDALLREKTDLLVLLSMERSFYYAQISGLCRRELRQFPQVSPSMYPCGPCVIRRRPLLICNTCPIIAAISDLKVSVATAIGVIDVKEKSFKEQLCLKALNHLHQAKQWQARAEVSLYELSALYSDIARVEK